MVGRNMRPRRVRVVDHPLSLALFCLALVACALAGASLPHTHDPGRPGVYNQEHDLGYFATFGGGGLVPDAPSAAPLVVLVALAPVSLPVAAPVLARRHADFRAPPLS